MLLVLVLLACGPTGTDKEGSDEDTGDTALRPGCALVEGAPTFTLVHGALDGEVAVPWYDPVEETAGVVGVDGEGCVTWSVPTSLYPAVARWKGETLWFNEMARAQTINSVDLTTGERVTIDAPRAHHDFYVHDDGTVAWLEEEVRNIDGVAILGDLVRERAPDGTERQVWSAFERLALADATVEWCAAKEPLDWTHANGMSWSPQTDAYVVSLYCTAQLVEIDRDTGANLRVLDGQAASSPFGPQHAPSVSPTGVRIFDNAGPDGSSRLLDVTWEGAITWEWAPEDGLETPVLGDVRVREDGVVLASFGAEGVVLAVDTEGEEIWRVEAPGTVLGRIDWRE